MSKVMCSLSLQKSLLANKLSSPGRPHVDSAPLLTRRVYFVCSQRRRPGRSSYKAFSWNPRKADAKARCRTSCIACVDLT